eukprot:gnl/Chilomastix_cuspidata/2004.p1 GENE.gnl/Chilomastix_cuspidata/2004~~gnl/Chilomastix_cuspidata/2004.p1  ORF type:complete len:264 (+),score=107.18 gnl/Chilomastix_cuspidata/2004:397-1188(+)
MAHFQRPGTRTYRASTLLGNWFEERLALDERIAEYQEKQKKQTLLSHQVTQAFKRITAPAETQQATPGFISHGDIMFLFNHNGGALLFACDPRDKVAGVERGFAATATPALSKTVRTLVRVVIPDGGELRFGTYFALAPHPALADGELLHSWARSALIFTGRSDEQAVAFAPADDEFPPLATFRAEHPDPLLRLEMEGVPVRTGDPLVIRHSRTGRALACTRVPRPSDLVPEEFELVCHLGLDQYRRERPDNIWTFECPGAAE